MQRQSEPPPYITFRSTHRQHNAPESSISRIINGLADYNLHKHRVLNRVRTKMDKYDYSSETLEAATGRLPRVSRRSNSLSSKNVQTLPIDPPQVLSKRMRLRSLERENDLYPSPTKLTPLSKLTLVDRALQTALGLRNRTQAATNRTAVKREVAPYRLLKRKLAEVLRKQPQQTILTKFRSRASVSGKRFVSNKKVQFASRLDSIDGWDTNEPHDQHFL